MLGNDQIRLLIFELAFECGMYASKTPQCEIKFRTFTVLKVINDDNELIYI